MWVRSFDLDHLDLYWEIAPVAARAGGDSIQHEIFDYHFYILRSEAALGPYETLAGPLRDKYSFRDVQVQLIHKWRQYFYKIKVVHVPSGDEKVFGPTTSTEPPLDLVGNEIVSQENLLFREYAGRKCWLYPARTFGPVCSCFDVYTRQKLRANHAPCYGTGWLGGFMSPVEVWVQIDPYPKNPTLTENGELHINNTTGRTSAYPPLSPRDILIESENRRWRVETVTPTQRLRATVRQELVLHEIPKGDIEYTLPLNVTARDVTPAAERNFTNPHHIENDSDYSDIFAAYGRPIGAI